VREGSWRKLTQANKRLTFTSAREGGNGGGSKKWYTGSGE